MWFGFSFVFGLWFDAAAVDSLFIDIIAFSFFSFTNCGYHCRDIIFDITDPIYLEQLRPFMFICLYFRFPLNTKRFMTAI